MFKKGRFRNWVLSLLLASCVEPSKVSSVEEAKLVKVAVIDGGLTTSAIKTMKLCRTGHYDLVNHVEGIGTDDLQNKHGTEMAQAIVDHAEGNYCLLIYKVFNKHYVGTATNVAAAVSLAKRNGAKIINLSVSSQSNDSFSTAELLSLRAAGNAGIKIFVAAGNDNSDLDKTCNVFPACYKFVKNFTVVGARKIPFFENKSNYGRIVTRFESFRYGSLGGTSVSTAIASGKTIKEISYGKKSK